MSYILDALRRADAERDRGLVPGLHAQAEPFAPERDMDGRRLPTWSWFVAGLLVMLVAALAWKLLSSQPVQVALTAPSPAGPASTAVSTAASASFAPSAVPVLPPTAEEHRTETPTPPVAPTHAPRKAKADVRKVPESRTESKHAAKPAIKPATTKPEPRAETAERIYTQQDLPENIRRELPRLDIGGSIYSTDAASRFLIINGRVFHEHDQVTHELRLEEIRFKAAVLSFKGYRYSIVF
jgi:general secretion pathway protein B